MYIIIILVVKTYGKLFGGIFKKLSKNGALNAINEESFKPNMPHFIIVSFAKLLYREKVNLK